MRYATPELVVIGAASSVVQGAPFGQLDNGGSDTTQPPAGVLLGLDN